jgi:uncharacterized delta-60 repeat protein
MKKIFSIFFLALTSGAFAQSGAKDTTFNIGTGFTAGAFSGAVSATAIQSDGKIIAVGGFTEYNGVTQNYIARLHPDGSLDTTFDIGTGFNSPASCIAIQPSNGKIIVGGSFTQFDGGTSNYIIRLDSTGSEDPIFFPSPGFSGRVNGVAIQTDGKVIAGGSFTQFNGTTQRRIARLNNDGSRDATFAVGTAFDSDVLSVILQSDGKIIFSGNFGTFAGTAAYRSARLNSDGSIDNSFQGFNDIIYAAVTQPDGKMIVGGKFTYYNNSGVNANRNRIVRLNTDMTLDTTFNIGTGFSSSGFTGEVRAISLQADGKIIVAGSFSEFNGTTANYIARLNADGTLDNTFNTGTGFDAAGSATAIQADGKIIIAGGFTNYNGTTTNAIVRLLPTTIVGIAENTTNAAFTFDVYPNPTNSMVSVSVPDVLLGQKISLLNTIGQVLETKNINATTMSYDLANLANGIYFIQVQTNKGIVTKKVVKQ